VPVLIDKGWEDDARVQLKNGLDRIEELIGKRPRGVWCSEQAISPKTLGLLNELGVEWTVGDEGILSSSINFEFVRDFNGYLENPYRLLKTYRYNDVNLVFRNANHANMISFEYYKKTAEAAANDLYDRVKTIQSKLLSSPDENHLLTIAMDGENCWEFYLNDGAEFLNRLYELIENDESLETVLLSDYIANDKPKQLNKLASGSWINRDFKLWTGEPMKDKAWDYLKRVRNDFEGKSELAQRELFVCEGSDWFWWYGEPNNSGKDALFDYMFREHLKNVYMYQELAIPEFLDTPIEG
jgi:alpha-amylase/alpha-mannosidase (GH57 family)